MLVYVEHREPREERALAKLRNHPRRQQRMTSQVEKKVIRDGHLRRREQPAPRICNLRLDFVRWWNNLSANGGRRLLLLRGRQRFAVNFSTRKCRQAGDRFKNRWHHVSRQP